MLISVPSHAQPGSKSKHSTLGRRKHVPLAEQPSDVGNPQSPSAPQSASVAQVPFGGGALEPLVPELAAPEEEPPPADASAAAQNSR
jgi:hypothetical protein